MPTDPSLVDLETGDEQPLTTSHDVSFPPAPKPEAVAGASFQAISTDEWNVLNAPIEPGELDVKPDSTGAVYMSHIHVRRRLNDAFRPMGWALIPVTDARFDPNSKVVVQWWDLFIHGNFAARAMGGQKYLGDSNDNMTFDDAVEGAKSNALMRCCKDLGVAAACWDRSFADIWRGEHCVKVWIKGKNKPQWRKIEALPFYNEERLADDSPNSDRYVQPKTKDAPKQAPKPQGQQQAPKGQKQLPQQTGQKADPKGEQVVAPSDIKKLWAESRAAKIPDEDLAARIKHAGYAKSHEIKRKDLPALQNWIKGYWTN